MRVEPLDLSEARYKLLEQRQPSGRPRMSITEAGRMDRLSFDWIFRLLSSNQVVGMDQDRIVSRSRELANDDTTMAKFLNAIQKNVFGADGIRLQSKIMLKRGGRPNTTLNPLIQEAWKQWGKKGNCTWDGRMSWVQFQKLVGRTVAVDGECFIRKIIDPKNPYFFSLQIVNADRVDRTYGRNSPQILPNKNFLFMGIEADPDSGAVQAYHIFNRHPAEAGAGPRQRIRVPASEIIHLYLPLYDNQWRGLPWAMPAMWRMNQLKGYVEAEVVAARVAACQMGFLTRDIDPDAVYTGTGADPGRDYKNDQNFPMEPGAFGQLGPGENITQFKPEHPTSAFPSFVKETKLDIAAGLDLAYMTLSGDVGSANYSSARVGLLDERDTWESLQGWYVDELCEPIYTAWIKMAYLSLRLPGEWRDYNQPEWHPRAFPWVDPLKDVQAELLRLQNGLSTWHKTLGKLGYDFEEIVTELAEEHKRFDELGIVVGTDIRGNATAATDPAAEAAGTADQQKDSGGSPNASLTQRFLMMAAERAAKDE